MKVAFCLSGMPRNIENSYQWLKDSVLSVLDIHDCKYDFFISTWNQNLQKEGDKSVTTYKSDINDFIKYFHPVKFETEDWDDNIKNQLRWPEFEKCKFEIEPRSSALGQFYKITKCNHLRLAHEKEHNIKYDAIFRIRTEIRYNNKLDFKELEILRDNKQPIIFLRRGPNPQHVFWFKDTFAFGNDAGMNIYCDISNHAVDIAKSTRVSTAELILRNWISTTEALVEHTSLDYTLIRN